MLGQSDADERLWGGGVLPEGTVCGAARGVHAAAYEAQIRHIGGGNASCTTSKNRLVDLIMAVSDRSESGHFGQVETMIFCRAGAHNAYGQHGHGVNCEPV